MKEVKIGIVGLGIGKMNAAALARNPRGRVVALCDLSEERMQAFGAQLPEPVTCYTDYKKMCKDADIDAVFVGTPNPLHVPMVVEAVRRDKHVLVTKPLSDSVASAKRAVEAAERAGVVNMMSLSTRFGSPCRYLGKLAQRGEFGELYYAHARDIRRKGIVTNPAFLAKSSGAWRDMGVHVLDAAWWLLGMPKPLAVSGVSGAKFGPRGKGYACDEPPPKKLYSQYACDDYTGGFVRFEGGIGLQVESFWASHHPKAELQIELFGTDAGASLSPLMLYKTVEGGTQDIAVNEPEGGGVWNVIAGHFIDSILDGKTCPAPLRQGLQVQEMLEGMLRSAKLGREVRLA